jgi:hypothetical protein
VADVPSGPIWTPPPTKRIKKTSLHATICFCVRNQQNRIDSFVIRYILHSAYEDQVLVGCTGVYYGDSPKFRRNILPASSGLRSQPRKRPEQASSKLSLHLLVSCMIYFSVLKMEAICYSEKTQCLRTTRSKELINTHQFMRREGSVPWSQDSATSFYPEPDESSLHPPIPLPVDKF